MIDYCLLCGEVVAKDKWREHMKNKHHCVLLSNPKYKNGAWKARYAYKEK